MGRITAAAVLLLLVTVCSLHAPAVGEVAVVEMAVDALMFNESDGSVMVCAELAAGIISECQITVVFGLTDPQDTACYPDNYNASTDPVPIDQGMACLDITIIQDLLLEGSQAFTVSIASLDVTCLGDVIVSNTSSTTVVTIEDDDEAEVALSQAVYRVEEEAMSVEVQVELVSLPAGGLESNITVTLTTMDGRKAMNNMDFLLEDMVVTFDLNSTAGDTQNATISITDDDIFEGAHNFSVSIVSASPAPNVVVVSPSSAVVIISDNDGPGETIEKSIPVVAIAGAGGGVLVAIGVLAAIVIIIVCVLRKRKSRNRKFSTDRNISRDEATMTTNTAYIAVHGESAKFNDLELYSEAHQMEENAAYGNTTVGESIPTEENAAYGNTTVGETIPTEENAAKQYDYIYI